MGFFSNQKPQPKDSDRRTLRRVIVADPVCRRHGVHFKPGSVCAKCGEEERQVQTHNCRDGKRRTMRGGVCPGPFC